MTLDEEKMPRDRTDRLAAYVLARLDADTRPAALREALRAIDPLERRSVRTRAQRAIDDAVTAAPHAGVAHSQRLAYLDLVGVYLPLEEMTDIEKVKARFEADGPKATERPRWRTSIISAIAIVVSLISISAFTVLRPVPFEGLHAGEGGKRDAYRAGGVPVHNAMHDTIFGDLFPKLVVAASRVRFHGDRFQGEADDAAQRLAAQDVRDALPSAVHARLDALARAYVAWAREAGDVNGIVLAARHLDDALARTGLGYFVDALHTRGDERGGNVVLAAYRVERVGHFSGGGVTERVLFVRRIDRLNVRQSSLGYTRHDAEVALVLVDSIDTHLVEVLLPLLAEGSLPTLVDPRTTYAERPWLEPVHARAKDVVRRELAGEGHDEAMSEIARILERRRVLHYQLMERTSRAGFVLAHPSRYDFEHEGLDRIEPAPPERRELESLRDALGERENVQAFVRARTRLEDTIAWQNVQFRVDHRTQHLPVPAPLLTLLDPSGVAEPGRFDGGEATRKLSAYLATIARDAHTAGLALTLAIRSVIDDRFGGSGEDQAAWVLMPELARTLHIGSGKAPIELRASDIADLYVKLSRVPGTRLQGAARATWARLYGRPLPAVRRID